MRTVRLALVLAIVLLAGCAANSAAVGGLEKFTAAGLMAPTVAIGDGSWHEVLPAAVEEVATQDWSGRQRSMSQRWQRHVTVMGGERWLDDSGEDSWEPLDNPMALGVEFDSSQSSGHGYEVGVLYTNDDDDSVPTPLGSMDTEVTTWELYGGYRHTFLQGEDIHPFVSLGVGVENAELEGEIAGISDSDDDTVLGAYARAGLLWDLSDRLRLGLDYRHFFAGDLEATLTGGGFGLAFEGDADYDQAMLSLGWAF